MRIWHLSSMSSISWTDLVLSFVAGKFIVGALTWFAESFLRNRLLSWLEKGGKEKNFHGTSWFGRITQSEVGTRVFIDRLHGAVLWLVAGPVMGYGCVLIALRSYGFDYSDLPLAILYFSDVDSYEALFIKLARYHVLLSWVYVVGGVLVEVAWATLRDLHDAVYSEKYLVGRTLKNLVGERRTVDATAAADTSAAEATAAS